MKTEQKSTEINMWHPPARDHGGEDIPDFFAHMLVKEVVGMLVVKHGFGLPVENGINEIIERSDIVDTRLKESECYFYGDGSIFMDYKEMRHRAWKKLGEQDGVNETDAAVARGLNITKEQFNPNMTTSRALELARSIVETWEWSQS